MATTSMRLGRGGSDDEAPLDTGDVGGEGDLSGGGGLDAGGTGAGGGLSGGGSAGDGEVCKEQVS